MGKADHARLAGLSGRPQRRKDRVKLAKLATELERVRLRVMRSLLLVAGTTFTLLSSGCGGARGPAEPVDLAGTYGQTDLATLTDEQWAESQAAMAEASGLSLPTDPAQRGGGVLAVLYAAGGSLLVTADGDDLQLALTDGTGSSAWVLPVDLGPGWQFESIMAGTRAAIDSDLVVLTVAGGDGPAARLVLAVEANRAMVVRAESADGHLANAGLSTSHPGLALAAGDLSEGAGIVDQLAGLVALAQPAAAGQRAEAGVRSNLEGLAAGTDLWLVTAAAEVLTLPTE